MEIKKLTTVERIYMETLTHSSGTINAEYYCMCAVSLIGTVDSVVQMQGMDQPITDPI
mgnify:FL=1